MALNSVPSMVFVPSGWLVHGQYSHLDGKGVEHRTTAFRYNPYHKTQSRVRIDVSVGVVPSVLWILPLLLALFDDDRVDPLLRCRLYFCLSMIYPVLRWAVVRFFPRENYLIPPPVESR